jgi:hypothetical protein
MATDTEQEEAFQLVRQQYRNRGFGGKLSCAWRKLETIVAVRNSTIVGTVSMATDTGPNSLPSEHCFAGDDLSAALAAMRHARYRVVETTCLAGVGNCSVGMGLSRASLHWHMQNGTDIVIVVVADHHVNMYAKNLLFKPVVPPRWCEDHHTTDYALQLDIHDPEGYWRRLAKTNSKTFAFYQDTAGIEFETYKLAVAC